jgi:hypothetical protein
MAEEARRLADRGGVKSRGVGMSRGKWFAAVLVASVVVMGACGRGNSADETARKQAAAADALDAVVEQKIGLAVSNPQVLQPETARNPTVAVDPESGTVYTAWARELPVPTGDGKDPLLEAVVARSGDGGKTFEPPVVVSPPGTRVASYTVSPTQVEVGPGGEVYVLFLKNVEADLPGYEYGLSFMQLVRSDDGGRTFSAPVDVAPEATEGMVTSMEMATLFIAPDGDLFVSFLDFREEIGVALDKKAGKVPLEDKGAHSGHGDKEAPATQMRLVRSADGGKTFTRSVLVSKPTCACCGTKVAQGEDTPLFVTTRSDWKELKGSKDSVRDPFLSVSADDGATFSEPVKISDDRFKVSGCPDVNAGLSTDSKGLLHAAWYTGTDRGPGVYHAVSKDDGKTFSPPTPLMRDEWVPYGDVQMVLDDKDRPWVAYEDRRGDVDMIQVVRIDADGRRTYTETWEGHAPDLAVHDGGAFVVWGTKAGAEDKSGPVKVATVRVAEGSDAQRAR